LITPPSFLFLLIFKKKRNDDSTFTLQIERKNQKPRTNTMAELHRRFGGATIIGSTTPFSSALARNEREIDSLLTDVDKADADKATDEFLKSGKPLETSDELFAGAANGATSTVAPTATTTSTTSTAASGSAASAEADPATTAEQRGNVASSGFAPETVASTPTEDTGTFDSLYYAPAGYKSRLVPFVQFYQDGSKKDKGKPLPGAYSAVRWSPNC
jgi:hypothetical protein